MEKENKMGLIILIIVLIIIVLGLSGFILWDKVLKKQNNIEKNETNETTNNNIIKTVLKEYVLNNEKHIIKYVYYVKTNTEYNEIKLSIYINDNQVKYGNNKEDIIVYYDTENNLDKIKNKINDEIDNINIITTKDNVDCFAILIKSASIWADIPSEHLELISSNGDFIYEVETIEGQGLIVDDNTRNYDNSKFVFENNSIYYITLSNNSSTRNIIDEHEITVYNNVATDTIVRSVTGSSSGAV